MPDNISTKSSIALECKVLRFNVLSMKTIVKEGYLNIFTRGFFLVE